MSRVHRDERRTGDVVTVLLRLLQHRLVGVEVGPALVEVLELRVTREGEVRDERPQAR